MGMAYDAAATAPIYSNYTYSVQANNEMTYSDLSGGTVPVATVVINLGADKTINGIKYHVTGSIAFDSLNKTNQLNSTIVPGHRKLSKQAKFEPIRFTSSITSTKSSVMQS